MRGSCPQQIARHGLALRPAGEGRARSEAQWQDTETAGASPSVTVDGELSVVVGSARHTRHIRPLARLGAGRRYPDQRPTVLADSEKYIMTYERALHWLTQRGCPYAAANELFFVAARGYEVRS